MLVNASTITPDGYSILTNKNEAVMKVTDYNSGLCAKLKNSYITYEFEISDVNHKNYSSIEIEEILASGCNVQGSFKVNKTIIGIELIYESNNKTELIDGFDAKLVSEIARSLEFVGQF